MVKPTLHVTQRFPAFRFVIRTALPSRTVLRVLQGAIDEPATIIGFASVERIHGAMQAQTFHGRLPGSLLFSAPMPTVAGEVVSQPGETIVNVRATLWPAFVPVVLGLVATVFVFLFSDPTGRWNTVGVISVPTIFPLVLYSLEMRRVRLFFTALLLPPPR
jgi:hypothetical protein